MIKFLNPRKTVPPYIKEKNGNLEEALISWKTKMCGQGGLRDLNMTNR
jgi:hypothetical protein